jgi:hypothetical protein
MNKNIVFDLDETIGYFGQIIYIMNTAKLKNVYELFDLFPEYFRTNIFEVFQYIIRLKKEGKIKSVILYSNNNNDEFINYVISYIHKKINYELFDLSISLNTPLRMKKTNNLKNLNDLILCSNGLLTDSSSICFIDDKIHDGMKHKKVYYINCEPYKCTLSSSIIFKRLNIKICDEKNKYNICQSIHSLISKEIIKKIRLFLMINM